MIGGARPQGSGAAGCPEGDGRDGEVIEAENVMDALGTDPEREEEVADLFGDFGEDEQEASSSRDAQPSSEPAAQPSQEQAEEEVPPPPNPVLPVCPSQEDWDEHFRTHINFRNWCPVCVRSSGRDLAHKSKDTKERECPEYAFDYCFPGNELGFKWTTLISTF